MSLDGRRTQAVLYDENGNVVNISNGKLEVEATFGAINIGAIVNDCNKFLYNAEYSINAKSPTEETLITYTVPTGKEFRFVAFQLNSDSPLAVDVRIKVDGTTIMKHYVENGVQVDTRELYTSPTKIADAGQTITVTSEAQTKKGEISVVLVGIES